MFFRLIKFLRIFKKALERLEQALEDEEYEEELDEELDAELEEADDDLTFDQLVTDEEENDGIELMDIPAEEEADGDDDLTFDQLESVDATDDDVSYTSLDLSEAPAEEITEEIEEIEETEITEEAETVEATDAVVEESVGLETLEELPEKKDKKKGRKRRSISIPAFLLSSVALVLATLMLTYSICTEAFKSKYAIVVDKGILISVSVGILLGGICAIGNLWTDICPINIARTKEQCRQSQHKHQYQNCRKFLHIPSLLCQLST